MEKYKKGDGVKIIIHQKYKNKYTNETYIIESIKGDGIIIKSEFGSKITSIDLAEFEKKFIENFTSVKEVLIAKNRCNYIKVNFQEMLHKLNGAGICDFCGEPALENFNTAEAFLIPVLNSVYCGKCFTRWENTAKRYDEDISYENKKTDYYLKILNGEIK
jgi:hypothetical protein